MLDSKIRHTVYNKIAMQYRRFNRDKNWRTDTIIDGLTFPEALKRALEDEEKRQLLGIERHEVKSKPKTESPEMPNPIQLLPEKPQKSVEDIRKEIGSVETKRGDNTGFDNLENLLKQTFGTDERDKQLEEERKEIERQVNESLERQALRGICPICKSSVCRCQREE